MATFLGAAPAAAALGGGYVKPHDFRLTRAPSDAAPDAAVAQVAVVRVVGPRVRLQLRLQASGERLEVDVARQAFEELGAGAGDLVVVDVHNARVFLGDYTI
jgi:sulfate transport system ATP-binding protein